MYRVALSLLLSLGVVACSSGGSTGGGDSGGGFVPENTLNKRIKTKSIDLDQDGDIDIETTYNYDAQNRVSTRVVEYANQPSNNETITYLYQDDLLISKTSSLGAQDTHTYENGLLVASTRSWDGDHTYQYNAQGQLIASTGEDFFYNDDCDFVGTPGNDVKPSFELTYSGNKVSTATTTDGIYSFSTEYDGQRLREITEQYNCAGSQTEDDPLVTTISYNSNNLPTRVERFDGFSLDVLTIEYGSDGKASRVIDTDSFGTSTTVLSYSDDGLILQQEVNNTNQNSFFTSPDLTVIIGYEDGTCVVSLSSNPAKIAIAEAFYSGTGVNPYTNCGYPLDEGEI